MKKILILLMAVCLSRCSLFRMGDNLRAMYRQPIEVAFGCKEGISYCF
ncbi:MAG: hypothetical protein NC218_08715 [Acetobacter sp.]|nr:hypothetical protein [Acetobacter sp.]